MPRKLDYKMLLLKTLEEHEAAFPEKMKYYAGFIDPGEKMIVSDALGDEIDKAPDLNGGIFGVLKLLMEETAKAPAAMVPLEGSVANLERDILLIVVRENKVEEQEPDLHEVVFFHYLYHELGHHLVQGGMSAGSLGADHYAECAADLYAALMHMKIFGDKDFVSTNMLDALRGDDYLIHATSYAYELLEDVTVEDVRKMSLRDIAAKVPVLLDKGIMLTEDLESLSGAFKHVREFLCNHGKKEKVNTIDFIASLRTAWKKAGEKEFVAGYLHEVLGDLRQPRNLNGMKNFLRKEAGLS